MALYFRNVRWFCRLSGLLGQHSLSVINSNPTKYRECREQMERLVLEPIPDIVLKKRLNMIFSVSNLGESLGNYRQCLYSLIRSDSIDSQSDLDRIVHWLSSQLRVNNAITEDDILERIKECDPSALVRELDSLFEREGASQDISQLSKSMRDKYPSVDSKVIYKEISSRFTNSQKK